MNPETNRFEKLTKVSKPGYSELEGEVRNLKKALEAQSACDNGSVLLRPNGTPVPKHWTVFTIGELVDIKGYTFRVAYIGETNILFEPVSPTDTLGGQRSQR